MLLTAVLAAGAFAQPAEVELETRWVFDADAAHAGATVRAAIEVRLPATFHVNSDRPLDEYLIPTALTVTPPAGFTVREIVYPDPVLIDVRFSEERLSVFEHEFVIGVALDVGAGVTPGRYVIPSALAYQACDDTFCLAPSSVAFESTIEVVPEAAAITATASPLFARIDFAGADAPASPRTPRTRVSPPPNAGETPTDCDVMAVVDGFTLAGTAGGYLGRDDFLQFIDDAETGTVRENLLAGKGPIAIIVLVVLGGIALNLTPCVLPLIPINLGIIGAGAQARSRARGFALGGAYGFAMAVVYGALGLIVILTASTFGAINSTIWFNAAIAVLFVLLALAMFDVVQIDFSRFQGKFAPADMARRGTLVLAFAMGAVTALLAGACVAPVVIQVIVYSGDQYARGTTLALGLPFFLGLGMGLPWPLAGAGLSLLPKPGPWMMRVKYVLGLFILACAAYYAYLAWEIYDGTRVDRDLVARAVSERLDDGWTGSICDGLATARAEDRLVLVDMWATWCKNCLAMDQTTFRDDEVTARLEGYVKVKFQAEDLASSPARELLERFEGVGLPAYAILRPPDRDDRSQQ